MRAELPSSVSGSSPEAQALTALDDPLGKGVVVMVHLPAAIVQLQVIVAAVVSMAAPAGEDRRWVLSRLVPGSPAPEENPRPP